MLFRAACSTVAGRTHLSGSRSTDVIQTVLKSQYWQWQPCSCLLRRIHLAGAHFACAYLAGIIVSCGVLDPFLGKTRRVAPSSPGRAPMPVVRWGRQNWGAFVLLEFLWRIHHKYRLRGVTLVCQHKPESPKCTVMTTDPCLSLQSRYSHSRMLERFHCPNKAVIWGLSVLPKCWACKLFFQAVLHPWKFHLQENDGEKGQLKYKQANLKCPTSLRLSDGDCLALWDPVGNVLVAMGKFTVTLCCLLSGLWHPDMESQWAVIITDPILVLDFKDIFLLQIQPFLAKATEHGDKPVPTKS